LIGGQLNRLDRTGPLDLSQGTPRLVAGRCAKCDALTFPLRERDPADWSLLAWYSEDGLIVTTQFFGAKLQRYMQDHAIPDLTLAQVAEKAFANGSLTPHAWRRKALSVEEILGSALLRRRRARVRRARWRVGPASGLRGRRGAARRSGARRVRGEPRIGFTHVYGAPAVSACAVLSRS
jgi:hypothetical protein